MNYIHTDVHRFSAFRYVHTYACISMQPGPDDDESMIRIIAIVYISLFPFTHTHIYIFPTLNNLIYRVCKLYQYFSTCVCPYTSPFSSLLQLVTTTGSTVSHVGHVAHEPAQVLSRVLHVSPRGRVCGTLHPQTGSLHSSRNQQE